MLLQSLNAYVTLLIKQNKTGSIQCYNKLNNMTILSLYVVVSIGLFLSLFVRFHTMVYVSDVMLFRGNILVQKGHKIKPKLANGDYLCLLRQDR